MMRRENAARRRGVSAVEAAVVYPITILLLIGTTVLGLGVFRYQQLQALAREGARYASVHGPTYASEQSSSYATSATVLAYVETMAAGLQTSGLTCTVTWNPNPPTTGTPGVVTVQLNYTWKPEGYFQQMTLTASSTMPVVY